MLFKFFLLSIAIHGLLIVSTHVIPRAESPRNLMAPLEILRRFTPQDDNSYSASELKQLAQDAFTQNPLPTYPPMALSLKQEGTTHIKVKLSKEGTIEDLILKKTSGSQILDQAVREAVSHWNLPNPKKISVWLDLPPFHFQLKENTKTERMSGAP